MRPNSSSPSIYSVSDSDSSDYAPSVSETKRSSIKRKRAAPASTKSRTKTTIVKQARGKSKAVDDIEDIDNLGATVSRRHGMDYHSVDKIVDEKESLLEWFECVRWVEPGPKSGPIALTIPLGRKEVCLGVRNTTHL